MAVRPFGVQSRGERRSSSAFTLLAGRQEKERYSLPLKSGFRGNCLVPRLKRERKVELYC